MTLREDWILRKVFLSQLFPFPGESILKGYLYGLENFQV
ncbi:hypothetical protein LEP1GSC192_0909 [Leptospira sp. B5-022]|nr:hypothetical protein LEP1GSC192_0909 [Leptospira sp. B5-022]